MAKVRGTVACTARAYHITDWDIQKAIEQQTRILANQGKTVINTQMGVIQPTPSGEQTCIITLTWEADDTDPKYVPVATVGGCYIATAIYGSYDCPEVWTLRRYRDEVLAKTWHGRTFVRTYYAISPALVRWFGRKKWFKRIWKGKLDHMIAELQSKGMESTPYQDKNW